ncbi:HAMP domain-containing protein [Martelella alba]|uniref:histidine kinase n=1 Tax=Martelella alba TaxID=2590451 RepID=A0A506U4T7_9HYPH|nr:ATP-binding protein [Martelella alba]TPW29393.1 HAMP domain-containing protein [Martelella alba]
MKRFGLVTRLMLIIAAAFLAIQLVALILFLSLRVTSPVETLLKVPERIAALVELLDRSDTQTRSLVLAAGAGGDRTIAIIARPEPESGARFGLPRIRDAVENALIARGITNRTVRTRGVSGTVFGNDGSYEVYVELRDGSYLEVKLRDNVTIRLLGVPVGFFAGVTGLVIALVALIAIARQMRPLVALSRQVERFGTSAPQQPIDETGAAEIRQLIAAINRMQKRIDTLVSGRTMLLGSISHDMGTYLTRLRLRIEMMPESTRRDGAIADLEAMQALLAETLDFAAVSTAMQDGKGAPLVAALTSQLADIDRALYTFTAEMDEIRVALSEVALMRIVANLIGNAARYASHFDIQLSADAHHARLVIDDDGPGIAPEERDKVFEPFYRVEHSRSRETGGTGLGLTIVKQIVDAAGGTIVLTSSPASGLGVIITLPLMPG